MLPFIFLVIGILAQQTFADEPDAIVGGHRATEGQFSYQLSLRYNYNHICGASIIGKNKALTAAHCVYNMSPSAMKVAAGDLSIKGGDLYSIKKITIHPKYSPKQKHAWVNDVAVMTIEGEFKFSKNVAPIALPTSPPVPGQKCILSGWGRVCSTCPPSPVLLYMIQNTKARSECQQEFPGMPLTESHLCAFNQRGVGVCSGDSGGPLVSNGVQVGLTSWGMVPCGGGAPDVYTNVYPHVGFIKSA